MARLAVATLFATAAGSVRAVSNIDQGFALDGTTTYCQGVKGGGSGGALGLTDLPVDSVGKCPVGVTLTVAATTVKQKDNIAVTWKAKAISGLAINNFPSSVDVATRIPKAVGSSLVKACKAGTNCAAVIDSVPTGPANAETGVFDATGSKDLRAAQFSFSDVGDFIIVGKVVLPGDASLNISATEFIAFRKITVVDANTPISPSPSPTPAPSPSPSPAGVPTPAPASSPSTASGGSKAGSESSKSDSNATNESNVISPSDAGVVGTVKPRSDDISPSTSKGSTGEGSSSVDASTSSANGIFGSNSVLLGCVLAGCFVAFVMGFAFVMRRRTENKMMNEKSIDNPPDSRGSVGMLDSGDFAAAAKYVENKSARHKDPSPKMNNNPPIVLDASARGSEMNLSTDEYTQSYEQPYEPSYEQRDVSEVSSLASSMYSDTMSNFDDSSRNTQDDHLGSFDWKDSEYSRPTSSSLVSKGRGFSTASALSDLSEGPRESRIASEASVDSYAFAPSPRGSAADSYTGGYSESSRISGMSMYSDVSSVTDV